MTRIGYGQQSNTIFINRLNFTSPSFHPNDGNLLISGSQDGRMNLFDLRVKEKAISTFLSQSESVRDVQFSRFRDNTFASVQENGNVQIWNLRKPDHYCSQFTAHSGPVFSCDFHLEDQRYLATAGRDRTLKIWDIASSKPQLDYCISAIASVARIKWRPTQRTHIASSSLVVDFKIYIWDIARPFVPFANIQEHKDVVTDFIWRDANANVLISVGKDGSVHQHQIGEVENHWLKANPCALSMNNHNDLFLATSNYLIKDISPVNIINYLNTTGKENGASKEQQFVLNEPRRNAKSSTFSLLSSRDHLSDYSQSSNFAANPPVISSSLTTSPSPAVQLVRRGMQIFQHNQSISHQPTTTISSQLSVTNNGQQLASSQANFFRLFTSSAAYCKNKSKEISLDWFVETALSYQLVGKSIADTFDHNAAVAERLGRGQVAQTWRILKQLYVGSNVQHPSGQHAGTQASLKFSQSQSSSSVNASSSNNNQSSNEAASDKQPSAALDKVNDPKTRNNSGQQPPPQQGRHASGSAVASSGGLHENKFATTRSRLATYSGQSNRPPLANTTSVPLSLTQSNKSLTGGGKNDSDADESDDQFIEPAQTTPLDKEFGREHQDFFFGDGDVNDTHGLTSYDVATNEMLTELDDTAINPSEVQREAFQVGYRLSINDYCGSKFIPSNEIIAISSSNMRFRTSPYRPIST